MVAARLANLGEGRPSKTSSIELVTTQSESAALLNVGAASVKRAKKVQSKGDQSLIDAVDAGIVAVSDAASIVNLPKDEQAEIVQAAVATSKPNVKKARRAIHIAKQVADIESGNISLPVGKFDLIDIDPPWPYKDGKEQADYSPTGHRASNPYPEMDLSDISALPVSDHASDDCVLWLWTTHKFMRHSFKILDAWGFQDRAILTWTKDRMGLGRWMRSQSEFAIMATRGKPLITLTNQTTILDGPMREHSRKPDEFYSMVETLCPASRRLVWFGREARAGWHVGGNQPDQFDRLA